MNAKDFIIPTWPVSNKIRAYVTTVEGGVSKGPYQGLNLAHHVGDDPLAVRQNRQLLAEVCELPEQPLWVNQCHSSRVLEIPVAPQLVEEYYNTTSYSQNEKGKEENSALQELFAVDALYTEQLDTVCAILTADCVPILLCNDQETEVCAVHAGWQGILKGVIQNSVFNMKASQSKEDFLYAWIGPCIGPQSFVVGSDVLQKFCELDPDFSNCFSPKLDEEGKWLGDLPRICAMILEKCGLKLENIYFSNLDTFTSADFYSYRRDKVTGRFASLIWLESKKNKKVSLS